MGERSSAVDVLNETRALHAFQRGDFNRALTITGPPQLSSSRILEAFWPFEFIRCEVMRVRGYVYDASRALERLLPFDQTSLELQTTLAMHRGYYKGLLGDIAEGKLLLLTAHHLATKHGRKEHLGEVSLRQAMLCFPREDYKPAGALYRGVVDV